MPIRRGLTGALKIDWIVAASQAAGLSGRELFKALEAGNNDCNVASNTLFAEAWAAAQIYTAEK